MMKGLMNQESGFVIWQKAFNELQGDIKNWNVINKNA